MFNETSYLSGLGNEADGCPPGLYRRSGRNDPREPCITDPNFRQPVSSSGGVVSCYDPGAAPRSSGASTLIAAGPCAPGYRRNYCYGGCEADPSWRPLPGRESEFVKVGGTLVRRDAFDEFGMPSANGGGGGGDLLAGIDQTTLLMVAGGGLLLMVMMGKRR